MSRHLYSRTKTDILIPTFGPGRPTPSRPGSPGSPGRPGGPYGGEEINGRNVSPSSSKQFHFHFLNRVFDDKYNNSLVEVRG